MAKINVLDSAVYNRISAGEVVERPQSVVKELVENSIDAGANALTVHIENGGKTLIRVTDNGSGIESDSVLNAFLPHATSKIAGIDDLDKISSLGFRGEALASIASVAKITIKTRYIDEELGSLAVIHGGETVKKERASYSGGCVIEVADLFYNTPARAKFMKSDKSEERAVSAVMQELIICNYNVAINYFVDGKLKFSSLGDSLFGAIYTVYGKEYAEKLIEVSRETGGYSIKGFIGNKDHFMRNKGGQITIINGRVITNQNVSAAVANGYGNRLMTRCFPVFILDIVMPFDELDVNVTPNKSDVRFLDSRKIYSLCYHAVDDALNRNDKVSTFSDLIKKSGKSDIFKHEENCETPSIGAESKQKPITETIDKPKTDYKSVIIPSEPRRNSFTPAVISVKENKSGVNMSKVMSASKLCIEAEENLNGGNSKNTEYVKIAESAVSENFPITLSDISSALDYDVPHESNPVYRIVGQALGTYILIEMNGNLYVIDQHAAHERFLYDKFLSQLAENSVTVQDLLLPIVLSYNNYDSEKIAFYSPFLRELSIEIEEFGDNTYKISALPSVLSEMDIKKLLDELLSDGASLEKIKMHDLLRDKLAVRACKAAIKANCVLNDYEIECVMKTVGTVPLQCPHGRPAVIAFSRKDMDKLFKRTL